VPHHRLARQAIADAHGGAAGKGARSVASYDEDTTTMAVAAARNALHPLGPQAGAAVDQLWFATTAPSYADKTNATTVHAALRLDRETPAYDAVGSIRSAAGVLRSALLGIGTTLVVAADARTGLPNSTDEREGGDGAAALLIDDEGTGSSSTAGPVLAAYLGGASTTEEFVDRWRVPGDVRSKQWEERFGETRYVPLGTEAWKLALDRAGVAPAEVAQVLVAGPHARAVRQVGRTVSAGTGGVGDDLADAVGNTGAAHPFLVLVHALERAEPDQVLALVVLADGCDVFLFRTTAALAEHAPARTVASQIDAGRVGLPYAKFLSWTGMLTVQPPNRPEPARASSSAAVRNDAWKFGFVAATDEATGAVHMPPARVSYASGSLDEMQPRPMADVAGTVITFTIDRLAYSPSPPVVFAVVDFDGGGRLPVELTDVDAADVAIGDRVEMTFRRLNQSDGIHNYFWKARPIS
jgi:hydroxymethylglutaryl-CoA synthase